MNREFIIGTRGSLLARSQAGHIKKQLEDLSGRKFSLKIIKTQGDIILDRPLHELEGKDFFTKELDRSLEDKQIDLVVHSLKDLSTTRPQGIRLAAITKRTFPNDILIIAKNTKKELLAKKFNKKKFVIGSSSPRRQLHIENIKRFIPHICQSTEVIIERKNLRGNVDSRIQKLLDGDYDAIILAAAGLERLSYCEQGIQAIEKLKNQIDFMFLPTDLFTPAPGQGALGVDCREDDLELQEILKEINDDQTFIEATKEKKLFANFGGTCHLPMGIYCKSIHNKMLTTINGEVDTKRIVETNFEVTIPSPKGQKVFIGLSSIEGKTSEIVLDEMLEKKSLNSSLEITSNIHYLATIHAAENLLATINTHSAPIVFVSGSKTMMEMAGLGIWVNAAIEAQGESTFEALKESKTFNILIPGLKDQWNIWTKKNGFSKLGIVHPSYETVKREYDHNWSENLKQCRYFYWTSFSQFQDYARAFPFLINQRQELTFLCGLGKTHQKFNQHKIECLGIPSAKWLIEEIKENI
jgi:hydroxymethylbilane synthase